MHIWAIAPLLLLAIIIYAGRRIQQAFAGYITRKKLYWAVYLFLALSFFLSRGLTFGSPSLNKVLAWLAGYIMALLFYAFFILLLIDLIRILDRWLGFVPDFIKRSPAKIGIAVMLMLLGLLAYGTWNARHPVFTSYEVNIAKDAPAFEQLHVILVTDVHLGEIVNTARLENLVQQINQRNPDLVLIGGDLIDGDIAPFVEQNMGTILRQLHPRLGTYMALGNHDGNGQEAVPYFEAAGITVLSNQYQLIDNSFYLVGEDFGGYQNLANPDPQLADIITGINKTLPVILLKHAPANLEEARADGIDLQLSGHTHQGQLFPNNFITQKMYEVDWGYLQKDRLQVIVSTGFGTWGPPIRIGNTPEVVDLLINFKPGPQ
ncbi:MAG: metallophosphoesterase [Syntrophomonadaceae bacterium]|nr:metallophosphoesterase [Syntrophomonadaceae bacterium]